MLLHHPVNNYIYVYRMLEKAYMEGELKTIGVSNFYPHVLTNFCETVATHPMVNQVELHPYFTQEKAVETMKYYAVQPEAWASLGCGPRKNHRSAAAVVECTARCGGDPEIHTYRAH